MTTHERLAEARLEQLLARLPDRIARVIRRLRHPHARWQRIPLACLFLLGGVFSFLPILGLWMLPVGLVLLAEDVPLLRAGVYRFVNWLAVRKPGWFK